MAIRRSLLSIIMVCLLIQPFMAAAATNKAVGSVSGKLHKNSAAGAALSGVSVSGGGKSDTTDSNGAFKLNGIPAGKQSISFSKQGYESFQSTVSIASGKNANMGDRWLTEKVTTGSVSGKLHKNAASGAVLYGVSVSGGGKSDTTDSNGAFKLDGIPAGNQSISFSKQGYESFQTTVPIAAGHNANIGDRWLTEKVTTGSVSGKLHKNTASGAVLSGVSVSGGGKSDATDSNGTFKLDGIPAGNQSISFSKQGYESFQTTVPIAAGHNANIGDRRLTEITRTVSANLSPDFNSSAYRNDNNFWSSGYAPKEFYPSGKSPQLGNAKGNCTWYAYGRLLELGYKKSDINALTGQANQWDAQAKNSKNLRVDYAPQLHSIAQSDTINKNYGHVAVVEAVNNDGTITISESSYCPGCKDWDFLHRTRTIDKKEFTNYIQVLRN